MKILLLEWFIAVRYLRSQRRNGFVSIISLFSFLGILLGVATLIVVMSVMNGFREDLFERILGVKGHGDIVTVEQAFDNSQELKNYLEALPFIKHAIPVIEGQVLFSTRDHALGGVVRGMQAEDLLLRPVIAQSLSPDIIEDFKRGEGILIGRQMASELRLQRNSAITLTAPQGRHTAFGTVARTKTWKVIGIFSTEMYEYDRFFAFVPLEQAQRLFSLSGKIHKIEIDIGDPNAIDRVSPLIRRKLPSGFHFQSWKDINGSFYQALAVERRVMFLILTMIILIAAFNIISGQIMLVRDKARSIAILRSIGAQRTSIMRIFLLSGAMIGFLGTAFGLVLGVVFAANIERIRNFIENLFQTELFQAEIYYLVHLPSRLDFGQITVIVVMALSLSFLAAFYPAFRAGRLDPIDVLRHE